MGQEAIGGLGAGVQQKLIKMFKSMWGMERGAGQEVADIPARVMGWELEPGKANWGHRVCRVH